MNGTLVVFEGLDGVGKSTAIRAVEKSLRESGCKVVMYSGYNSTLGVETIRRALISDNFCQTAETLLFFASHVEHINKTIKPALEQGYIVLMDRYYYSTLAYQGSYDKCGAVYDVVRSELPDPDLVFYLKAPSEVRKQRLLAYRDFDEIEARDAEYFDRVERNYDNLAKEHKFIEIDASQSPADVLAECMATLSS